MHHSSLHISMQTTLSPALIWLRKRRRCVEKNYILRLTARATFFFSSRRIHVFFFFLFLARARLIGETEGSCTGNSFLFFFIANYRRGGNCVSRLFWWELRQVHTRNLVSRVVISFGGAVVCFCLDRILVGRTSDAGCWRHSFCFSCLRKIMIMVRMKFSGRVIIFIDGRDIYGSCYILGNNLWLRERGWDDLCGELHEKFRRQVFSV